MPVFTVHEPPDPPADRFDRADALVFVRDGFSWGVALFGPFWLAIRGQWLVLVIYAAAAVLLAAVLALAGATPEWASVTSFALNLFFAFEAGEIQRWLLTRRGWRELATVSGESRDACERRFFEAWFKGEHPGALRTFGHPEVRMLTGGWIETQARSLMHRLRSQFGTSAR